MHIGTEDQIRVRAYQLWEADGRPENQADTYWHRAAMEAVEVAAKKPARRAKPAKAADAPAVAEPAVKRRRASKAA